MYMTLQTRLEDERARTQAAFVVVRSFFILFLKTDETIKQNKFEPLA